MRYHGEEVVFDCVFAYSCSGCVRARLRRVFCLRTKACFFSFRGFRLVTLRPDLGGVWLF